MPSAAGRQDDLTILNGRRVRFGHIQRNLIFIFVFQKRLRAFLEHFFTRGGAKTSGSCSAAFCESAALRGKFFAKFQWAKLPQSKPDGFASSLWEGAFGMAV